MKSKSHIHTYARIKKRPNQLRCLHPDCSHTTERDLAVGKRALCPFCGEQYILTWRELRLAKPHCSNCTKGASAERQAKPRIDLSDISLKLRMVLTSEQTNEEVNR